MQPHAAFLPPLVQSLVCYDKSKSSPQELSPRRYLSDQGLLSVDAIQPCLPQSVVVQPDRPPVIVTAITTSITASASASAAAAAAMDPSELDPFKAACVSVHSELLQFSSDISKSLRNMYADLLEWLGVPGKRAAEIWFELYEKQIFDQAWIVGSTVLEQLVSNIIFTLQGSEKFIPFLVRDLLAVSCLTKCLDRTLIRVLKTMIGSPLTLNIRNLLWHGFILPEDDIPLDSYGAMLIVVTMTIIHSAKTRISSSSSSSTFPSLAIRHQNPKSFYFGQGTVNVADGFEALYEKIAYGTIPTCISSSRLLLDIMKALIHKSHFVTPGTVQQWITSCQHLEPKNESENEGKGNSSSSFVFVMTTLPLLEHAIRL
ncbi:hypothetical protein BGZ65_004791, partial [Modicella reniformis]